MTPSGASMGIILFLGTVVGVEDTIVVLTSCRLLPNDWAPLQYLLQVEQEQQRVIRLTADICGLWRASLLLS